MGKGSDARGGLSKSEWEAVNGRPWDGGGGSGDPIMDAIVGTIPDEKDPYMDFDEYYTAEDRAIDAESAEAMWKPKLTQDISDTLEDLDTWNENEATNYTRLLRRGRASMASQGGAVGRGESGERQKDEQEKTDDYNTKVDTTNRFAEREIGSEAFVNGGYDSFYGGNREGTLMQEYTANIEEDKLWSEQQRQNQYYADSNQYYNS